MKAQQETGNDRITAAIELLIKNCRGQRKPEEVANHTPPDAYSSQHMFREWVGITPGQFAQYLSVEHIKKVLKETRATLFNATGEAGLPANRLHDLVNIEGMTPDEYKNGGESLAINYSFANTPFGTVIIGSTGKGVCYIAFADEGEQGALQRMKMSFPNASYRQFLDKNQQDALFVFTPDWNKPDEIRLHLKGTDFQLEIWKTILQVPSGGLTTYTDLALKAGHEGAQRAVGTALGSNPVIFLIPCHRVVPVSGIIGNYRYGEERKNAIIGWEAAKRRP